MVFSLFFWPHFTDEAGYRSSRDLCFGLWLQTVSLSTLKDITRTFVGLKLPVHSQVLASDLFKELL